MEKHVHLTQADVEKINRELPKNEELEKLSNLFKVFGDNTRVRILFTLLGRELCVHDISLALDMSQSAISHQLRTLREATLVKFIKNGKEVIYSLDDDHVEKIFTLGLSHIKELK